jgi:signal transduction histidine kinase
MDRIPILRMGKCLLVTLQVDMQDQTAPRLQDDLSSAVERTGAAGVLIDISALEIVDSFIDRMLANISQRRSSAFSAFSVAGKGSVLYARIGRSGEPPSSAPAPAARFDVAGISLAAPGEHISGDGWHVRIGRLCTDDQKLSQILRNFISNALKFTVRGEVRVRAIPQADGFVTFGVSDTAAAASAISTRSPP